MPRDTHGFFRYNHLAPQPEECAIPTLILLGVNYRTAPVALRERLAIPARELPAALHALRAGGPLLEVAILSTCNRTELYAVTDDPTATRRHFLDLFSHRSRLAPAAFAPALYQHTDRDAVAHLFRVAAGLESMIPGESEVTAQVKHAYLTAHAAGTTGAMLNRLFQKALHSAKIIRTQTPIGEGQASIGSIVTALAQQRFGGRLHACEVLLWGAGKAAEATARHLVAHGVRQLWIVNRTQARAEELASLCRGGWVSWEQATAHLACVDIAIICTQAPHYVLQAEDRAGWLPQRRGRPLLLIDLAVPRNVDPALAAQDGVHLYNIDDLEAIAQATLAQRCGVLAHCAALIEAQVNHYWHRAPAAPRLEEAVPC